MKNLLRPLTLAAFILFILGIFVSLYFVFFVNPEAILHQVSAGSIDHTKLDMAKQASLPTLLLITVELLLGLVLIMGLLSNNRKFIGTENIVYVTNNGDAKQDKAQNDSTQSELSVYQANKEIIGKEIAACATNKEKLQVGLNQLCKVLQASIGALFVSKEIHSRKYIEFCIGYAYQLPDSKQLLYEYGEGISGQAAKDGKPIHISKVPQDYITVVSGLGKATPQYMLAMPFKRADQVVGVIEIASFTPFSAQDVEFVGEIAEEIGQYIQVEVRGVVLGKS